MRSRLRVVVTSLLFPLAVGCVLALVASLTPALAQTEEAPEQPVQAGGGGETETAGTGQAGEDELSRREHKQQAKEERIQEYLRKREERRARKEMNRSSREAEQAEAEAREIERRQLAAQQEALEKARLDAERTALEAAEAEQTVVTEPRNKRRRPSDAAPSATRLPKGLARAQENVRATELGLDPTVREYLDLIDTQGASPHELAAFGSFVAQNGMVREALEYYDVALRLAKDDAVLWINAGSLHLQTKNLSAAASAFTRALSVDPNNAVAHYNLGATYDEMNRYDDAVAAYRVALKLDPSLGDPTYNPQAANNDLLLAVKLLLYQEQTGSLAVPLLDVTTGRLPDAIVEDEEE